MDLGLHIAVHARKKSFLRHTVRLTAKLQLTKFINIDLLCRLVLSKQIVGRNESRKGHWLNKPCFLTGEADDNTEIRNLDIFLRHDHESRSDEGLRGDGD
jgi:hypothetical protein